MILLIFYLNSLYEEGRKNPNWEANVAKVVVKKVPLVL